MPLQNTIHSPFNKNLLNYRTTYLRWQWPRRLGWPPVTPTQRNTGCPRSLRSGRSGLRGRSGWSETPPPENVGSRHWLTGTQDVHWTPEQEGRKFSGYHLFFKVKLHGLRQPTHDQWEGTFAEMLPWLLSIALTKFLIKIASTSWWLFKFFTLIINILFFSVFV